MASLWSSQPFKSIYAVWFTSTAAIYLMAYSLRYIVRPLRPFREWSYATSLGAVALGYYFRYLTKVRFQQPRQMEPGKCGERFALIQPPSDKGGQALFTGVLAPKITQPAPVGALWHPAPVAVEEPPGGSEPIRRKVALVMAGGAFVLGWDPEATVQAVSSVLTESFGITNVLFAQYRLAAPETPFPAALQDVLTSYHYILGLGVPAEDITLVGDSAAGNLMIAFLRYLETTATPLPQPGAAMVFSPWVDLTPGAGKRYDRSIASQYDILCGSLLDWGVTSYRPTREKLLAACESTTEADALQREIEPFISPLNHPFRCRTPIFMQVGSVEGLFDTICQFARQMEGVEGNKIHFEISEHMPHDFFLPHPVLGTKEQVKDALEVASRFFDRVM
ncbi:Alpha/Beta hydrolase protein [Rostrohypoxylon terebratum]|nr:Alpha/Beta hydrolase protein [Rostrohypoxylon terebratum]